MCGIVAILSNGKSLRAYEAIADKMLEKIAHRGPDGSGIVHIPNQAILGHRRLAIVDIQHGDQPLQSSNKRYSLVFNGEIYNYRELREYLQGRGETFNTCSDSEVLLKLLISDGVKAIEKLNGMFAFMFHDSIKNSWIAARDHFGIKPLYYVQTDNGDIVFGSEIKVLHLFPSLSREKNFNGLQQYFTFQFCLNNETLFKNILKIRPGHYLTGSGAKIFSEVCYWDTKYDVDQSHSQEWFSSRLQELIQESVKLQINADVPVGAYLSGGMDSSIIITEAAKHFKSPIPAFHGRFLEGQNYDESRYALDVSENINGAYFEIVPTANDFVNLMPNLIAVLDEPIAGPGAFPQYMVSKLASKHVKVVLGGQGGDEIFGGYARYLIGYLEQALKGAIFETQKEGRHVVTLESIIPNLATLKQYRPLLTSFWSKGLFDEMDARYFHLIDRSEDISKLLHPDLLNQFNHEHLFEDFRLIFNHPKTESYINKMTHFDQKTLLPALLQIEDRVSMASSIESRVPFLDSRIVDLVSSMPPGIKFKGGVLKHILKKSSGHLLPQSVKNRKDKMGFPVPLVEWMQGGIVRDFVGDILLSTKSLQRGIYKPEALRGMLENQGVGGRQIWGALSLELWHRAYIDGET